jgi:Carboxypeptidase regulatory-like domain
VKLLKIGRPIRVAGVLLLALQAVAWQDHKQQKAATPEWTIAGTISDSSDSTPLTDATVVLHGPNYISLSTATDSSGHYSIVGTEPGSYQVSAKKKGYGSNAALPVYKTLSLAPGLPAGHADLTLDPEALISGRVLNSNKEPLPAVNVTAMVRSFSAGRVVLQSVAFAQTNDRGEYSLTGLLPANYLVRAVAPIENSLERPEGIDGSRKTVPQRTGLARAAYYPSVPSATAAAQIRLRAGEERTSVDIALATTEVHCVIGSAPVAASHLGGRVAVSISELVEGRTQGVASGNLSRSAFGLCGLERGAYQLNLYVFASNDGSSPLESMLTTPFEVGREDLDLGVLQPQPAAPMPGKAQLIGVKQGSEIPVGVKVRLMPRNRPLSVGEKLASVAMDPRGDFQFPAVLPGDYDLMVSGLPTGYYIESISQLGRDCVSSGVSPAAGPIRIELSADGASVGGRTVDRENNVVSDAVVLLIPENRGQTAIAVSDQGGAFRLDGAFPAGDYRLLAFVGIRPDEAQDPDLLRRYLGSALDVALGPGGVKSLTVQVRRIVPGY